MATKIATTFLDIELAEPVPMYLAWVPSPYSQRALFEQCWL
jgi:hypothetical protein